MYLKAFSTFVFLFAFLFAGCESSIKERFAEVPPKTHEFEASAERVYAAAQDAFRRLDFTIVWKSMGRIDAASAINRSLAMGDSRQLTVKMRFRESTPGVTEVEMWLTQDIVGEGTAGTYRKPLPGSDFFALYFTTVQQFLDIDGAAPSSEKK